MEVPAFTVHSLSGAIKAAITSVIMLALFFVLPHSLKAGTRTLLYLINKECMLTFLTLRLAVEFTFTSVSVPIKNVIFPIPLHSPD